MIDHLLAMTTYDDARDRIARFDGYRMHPSDRGLPAIGTTPVTDRGARRWSPRRPTSGRDARHS